MKFIFLLLFVALLPIDIDKIGKINALKSEAKKAFQEGNYTKAIENYRLLIDSMKVDEEEVRLNLANAYFHASDTANAYSAYRPLAQSKNKKFQSQANQQMGVLANRQGNLEEALTHFKQALKNDPTNEDARYNYEMVKKKLAEQQKQEQQQDQNQDQKDQEKQDQEKKDEQKQDQKDQQSKEQQDQQKKDQEQKQNEDQKKDQQEKKDQQQEEKEDQQNKEDEIPPSLSDKLKEMQISEEKARMILEAMKNQEIQYLQQNKRKATKPKDKGKPDW